jgi:hypothetical protein
MQPIVKAAVSVILMLSLAPVLAVSVLVFSNPDRWGESQHPVAILVMSFFGLFTTPLWPTYIPALILTPIVMHKLSQTAIFQRIPLSLLLGLALAVGAVAGAAVLVPMVLMEWADSRGYSTSWAKAGAVSGAITLTTIAILYYIGRPVKKIYPPY